VEKWKISEWIKCTVGLSSSSLCVNVNFAPNSEEEEDDDDADDCVSEM